MAPAPFKDARRLYQSIGGEFLKIDLAGDDELHNTIKNALCLGISSAEIEKALEPCMRKCLYKGTKIIDDSFEPEEAREDYLDICIEVIKENIRPFTKSLFAQFKAYTGLLETALQSASLKTQRGSSMISDSAPQAMGASPK